MNTKIQTALARVNALRQALGTAASKAGNFVGDEIKGTIANFNKPLSQKYEEMDQATAARNNAAATAAGFNGTAGYDEWSKKNGPQIDTSNMLGNLASKLVGVYRSIKKKK